MTSNYNILIVEDFKGFNNFLTNYLLGFGHTVSQAFTIKEATDILQNNNFEFILLDLILPDGTGEEIVYKYAKKSKIIILTADDDIQRRESLFAYGIFDYISKQNHYEYIQNELLSILNLLEMSRGTRLLTVDDSAFVRGLIKNIFEIRNYEVTQAKNGTEAIEIIKSDKEFDIVLLDMEMPDMTGEVVLKHIRKNPKLLRIPVIVLSGTKDKDLVSRILKHGADEFIAKPFSIEELILKVKIFLNLSYNQKKLTELYQMMELKVIEEVDKRREQERVMLQQSKLASMGEMIGNIAHQWRQPLNALSLIIDKISLAYESDSLTQENMEKSTLKAKTLIDNMSTTIDDFRNFFRPDKEKEYFSPFNVINHTMSMLEPTLKYMNIDINLKEENENIVLYGYPNELSQVVMVVINNSKDAIEENGIKAGFINITISNNNGNFFVSIEDNGGGISEKYQNRIFEPYFTTKTTKGTGVGLYMSKKIIEDSMNGKLSIENMNGGCRVDLIIPIEKSKN
jgi:DNA-binding response OmpR family regulator